MSLKKTTNQQDNHKNKRNQILSDIINSEEKSIFIKNNKKALMCFEDFIKSETKNRNQPTSLRLLNLNQHTNIEKFKKNPFLILKSYNKNLFDDKKRTYKSNTVGVDEGLIIVPKNKEINQSDNANAFGNETSRFKTSLNLNNIENEENKKVIKKRTTDNLAKSAKILSNKKITELERGKELVTKKLKTVKNSNEQNILLKMKKLNEDFKQQLNFNFELKKLNNWDYLNVPISRNNLSQSSRFENRRRKSIINFKNLNETEPSSMGWLLNIRNDKEKLKIVSRIKQLNDFFSGFGKEQDAILMQTMKINKKGFIFDAFYKSKEQLKDIKVDENEIISGVNFYREVMKVKTKREEMFKSEVCACAEQLHMAKIEKQKYIIASFELLNELEQLNKKKVEIINDLENFNKPKINHFFNSTKDRVNHRSEKQLYDIDDNMKNNNNNIYYYKDKNDKCKAHSNDKKLLKKEKYLKIKIKNNIMLQKMSKIKEQIKITEEKIKKNSLILNDIQMKHKKAKANYTEKVQMLSEYYYQILKKGIDVRKSGLSWVVVKLMELNAFIDSNHFPSFLNDSEINYLIKIGVKTYELNELIKLFQLLKTRQKKVREQHMKEDRDKENQLKEEKFNKLKESHKGLLYNIGNDYVEYMEEIQRKYESVINVCLNEKTEESNINQISEKIKKQILEMKDDGIDDIKNSKIYELFFIPGSLAQYFSQDKLFRQYFDDIYYLNEEINKRKRELKELKEKEYKKYRNKINTRNLVKAIMGNDSGSNSKRENEEDNVMAALFGNDIAV